MSFNEGGISAIGGGSAAEHQGRKKMQHWRTPWSEVSRARLLKELIRKGKISMECRRIPLKS